MSCHLDVSDPHSPIRFPPEDSEHSTQDIALQVIPKDTVQRESLKDRTILLLAALRP